MKFRLSEYYISKYQFLIKNINFDKFNSDNSIFFRRLKIDFFYNNLFLL